MTNLNILSSFISILLISSAIPSLCKSQNPPPTSKIGEANDKYINSLPKKLIEYLKNCTKYLPRECGEQVLNATLDHHNKGGDNNNVVNKKCCHDLVGMGLKCHKSLIKVYVGLPEVKGKIDAKVVKSNVSKVFKTCVILDKKEEKKKKEEKEGHYEPSPPILPF